MPSPSIILPLIALLPALTGAETVWGAYIFHRHGDRTPKSLPPVNLTTLGYEQTHTSGSYYRSRYVAADASSKIKGLNSDIVKLSQLSVTAPVDNVLQNSAMGFLQGLYPPVGSDLTAQTLANGTSVDAPLNGYQLIPVNTIASGSGAEDNGWLQDATGCANAKISSNNYFSSADYNSLLANTKNFYSDLYPVVEGVFSQEQVTFKNAYVVYDLINVATIHNSTIPSEDVLTNATLLQTRTLADAHEWGLAYNETDNMRAIAGMQLAGEVLTYMNNTINGKGAAKLGIQFGAYATFFSFFGLANLTAASPDFKGVTDYASSMVFELFSDSDNDTQFPATNDLRVRFLFHNGTATESSPPTVYPMFGQSETSVSWSDFSTKLSSFAVRTTEDWCTKCGNTTGTCAAYAPASTSNANGSDGKQSGHKGMSAAIGGVIGAMVTLAVILGLEALILAVSGLRLTKKRGAQAQGAAGAVAENKA